MYKQTPVSILLPVCDEEDVIEDVINEWNQKVLLKLPLGSEFVIEDASIDATPKILAKLKKKGVNINLNFFKKDGFHNAVRRLPHYTKNEIIFVTDADGQYPVEDFWKIYNSFEGYDIVNGYKKKRKDILFRIIISNVFNVIINLLFFRKIVNLDLNCLYRLMYKKTYVSLLDESKFLTNFPTTESNVIAHHRKLKIKYIGIISKKRKFGKSSSFPTKYIIFNILNFFIQIIKFRIFFNVK